eukprot:13911659-Alexandrium_andersonii.AAC.1
MHPRAQIRQSKGMLGSCPPCLTPPRRSRRSASPMKPHQGSMSAARPSLRWGLGACCSPMGSV